MEEDQELGGGDFQIRGLALLLNGDRRPQNIDAALRHASFEHEVEKESWVKAARGAGRIALAQAEYYFNHNGIKNKDPKEWMWNMDWRARLVRFRLPGGDDEESSSEDQSASEMDMSSFSAPGNADGLGLDIGSIDLPGDAPSLDTLEQLMVH
jgi:hypothetical protein